MARAETGAQGDSVTEQLIDIRRVLELAFRGEPLTPIEGSLLDGLLSGCMRYYLRWHAAVWS